MHQKRTPPHKRLVRAENAREEWKAKALERREEAERLKAADKRKTIRIEEILDKQKRLEAALAKKEQTIERLQDELKKNVFRIGRKAI